MSLLRETVLDNGGTCEIALIWTREDVRTALKAFNDSNSKSEELSLEEESMILENILSQHDASRGVNWDVLREEVAFFIQERA